MSGETLTKFSPEIVRLGAAVEAMNESEENLIERLRGADAEEASTLARDVADKRREFESAMRAVELATPPSQPTDQKGKQ